MITLPKKQVKFIHLHCTYLIFKSHSVISCQPEIGDSNNHYDVFFCVASKEFCINLSNLTTYPNWYHQFTQNDTHFWLHLMIL